tara:strand:- start:686 stop:1333 length:648 start_codon:yes stop_codon:yes gene_type:complete
VTVGHPAKALVHFFKQVPGCAFASNFAREGIDGRIAFAELSEPDADTVDDINASLDGCGVAERAACLIFPSVTTPDGIVDLLQRLSTDERWSCRRFERASDMLCVEWRTASGRTSRALGLAPMLSMPVTRRAPYVAIALWPGQQKKRKQPREDVGFIDMPSNLDSKKHRALISASTKNANAILGDDAAEHWREVAFRFPPTLSRLIPDHWWRVGT